MRVALIYPPTCDPTAPYLAVPTLGLVSRVVEPMGWGSSAEELRPYLAPRTVVEDIGELGHFLHIEAPELIARRVLGFLTGEDS